MSICLTRCLFRYEIPHSSPFACLLDSSKTSAHFPSYVLRLHLNTVRFFPRYVATYYLRNLTLVALVAFPPQIFMSHQLLITFHTYKTKNLGVAVTSYGTVFTLDDIKWHSIHARCHQMAQYSDEVTSNGTVFTLRNIKWHSIHTRWHQMAQYLHYMTSNGTVFTLGDIKRHSIYTT